MESTGQMGGAGSPPGNSMKSFINHVFSTTDEHTADMLNNVQYALLGVVPIMILNKTIQRFIPDIDPDKSAVEIVIEIVFQIISMVLGVIIINRAITFIPTYSGVKHDTLTLSSSTLLFLVVMLSVQTKLGAKMNILWDRGMAAWEGDSRQGARAGLRKHSSYVEGHTSSRSDGDDGDDSGGGGGGFIPPPIMQTRGIGGGGSDFRNIQEPMTPQIAPANALLGSAFGAY